MSPPLGKLVPRNTISHPDSLCMKQMLASTEPVVGGGEEGRFVFVASPSLRQWQGQMAVLLQQQRERGGVIDLAKKDDVIDLTWVSQWGGECAVTILCQVRPHRVQTASDDAARVEERKERDVSECQEQEVPGPETISELKPKPSSRSRIVHSRGGADARPDYNSDSRSTPSSSRTFASSRHSTSSTDSRSRHYHPDSRSELRPRHFGSRNTASDSRPRPNHPDSRSRQSDSRDPIFGSRSWGSSGHQPRVWHSGSRREPSRCSEPDDICPDKDSVREPHTVEEAKMRGRERRHNGHNIQSQSRDAVRTKKRGGKGRGREERDSRQERGAVCGAEELSGKR